MILEILNNILKKILEELNYDTNSNVIISNRPELCDYQFDGIFNLARINNENPITIGEKIVNKIKELKDFDNYFKTVEFVKPGFINITISDKLINDLVKKINTEENLGMKKPEKIETFFLDYGGPNIAKPLHVGHLRPAIIGESIKRIINFKGHKTISDVHFGDFGLQMGQVIYGMQQKNISYENVTLEDLNEIYPEMSKLCKENEQIKEICTEITKKMQDGDPLYEKYYDKIYELSSNDIKKIYKYLGVDFDLWYSEMSSRKYIPLVEEKINEKNISYISDGALVIDVKEKDDSKELPPLIFKKSNGAYLYGSTDMATIYQREQDYKPDHILYVADARQSLHFKQVFRASLKANITDASMEHLAFGTINGTDGKPYKTRSGETPKLTELFKEVKEIFISKKQENENMIEEDKDKIVNAIIKFADLQNNREKDYIFDISKFSNVVGKTGPYVLYTYVRTNKMINEEGKINDIIYNEFDRNLRKKIIEFDLEVEKAFKNRCPHHIADYVYDLCLTMNAFYQNNHINNLEDDEKRNSWIYILNTANKILKEMLYLLMIDIPTVM